MNRNQIANRKKSAAGLLRLVVVLAANSNHTPTEMTGETSISPAATPHEGYAQQQPTLPRDTARCAHPFTADPSIRHAQQ